VHDYTIGLQALEAERSRNEEQVQEMARWRNQYSDIQRTLLQERETTQDHVLRLEHKLAQRKAERRERKHRHHSDLHSAPMEQRQKSAFDHAYDGSRDTFAAAPQAASRLHSNLDARTFDAFSDEEPVRLGPNLPAQRATVSQPSHVLSKRSDHGDPDSHYSGQELKSSAEISAQQLHAPATVRVRASSPVMVSVTHNNGPDHQPNSPRSMHVMVETLDDPRSASPSRPLHTASPMVQPASSSAARTAAASGSEVLHAAAAAVHPVTLTTVSFSQPTTQSDVDFKLDSHTHHRPVADLNEAANSGLRTSAVGSASSMPTESGPFHLASKNSDVIRAKEQLQILWRYISIYNDVSQNCGCEAV